MTKNKVWFVTGASKGLGLALVEKLLAQGFHVAATSRNKEDLENAVTSNRDHFLPLEVHLTDEQSVENAINDTKERFGTIDVVVNNAGYGQIGAIEEVSDREVRDLFDVNVFGTLNVIRAVLPIMRNQQSGHIVNVSSISGFHAIPLSGTYGAAKHAVKGLTEALAQEVEPFGIKATCVLPGMFRTNFLNNESIRIANEPIAAYQEQNDKRAKFNASNDGTQIGDPQKAADVFIALSQQENPPVLLFLGKDANQVFENKISELKNQVSKWKELGTSTDFED